MITRCPTHASGCSPRLYHRPRSEIREQLKLLVSLPHFHVSNRDVVLLALDRYAASNLDFGDAMIVAAMQESGATELYSYDLDFDSFPLARREP